MSDHHEIRKELVGAAQDSLHDQRHFAQELARELRGRRDPSDPGNVGPFLAGVQVGLALGEHEIENRLDTEILYGPAEETDDA